MMRATSTGLLAAIVALLGCHEIVALDAPPHAGARARTAVWLVSTTDEVIGDRLVCPAADSTSALDTCLEVQVFPLTGAAEPPLPAFSRRGAVHLAYLEYACPPTALGLSEGMVTLTPKPSEELRLPRPIAAYTSDGGAWAATPADDGWVAVALRMMPVAGELRCKLRGVDFDTRPAPFLNEARAAALPSGEVLLLSADRTIRYSIGGQTDDLVLTSTRARNEHLTGAALVDEAQRLWIVDDHGAVRRAPFGDEMTAVRVGWVTPAPWSKLVSVGTDTFFMSTRADVGGPDRGPIAALARYDRGADRWTTLHYVATSSETAGATFNDILPLDADTVLMVGAETVVDISNLRAPVGRGRVLEVTRTSSTWSELVTSDGQPAIAVALADVPPYGVVASGILCGLGSSCERDVSMRSQLFRRDGTTWREIPGMRFDFGVFALAPMPRGVWLGGFWSLRLGGRGILARFDDGMTCDADRESARPSTLEILPYGERGLFVSGYLGEATRQFLLTPRESYDEECAASAF